MRVTRAYGPVGSVNGYTPVCPGFHGCVSLCITPSPQAAEKEEEDALSDLEKWLAKTGFYPPSEIKMADGGLPQRGYAKRWKTMTWWVWLGGVNRFTRYFFIFQHCGARSLCEQFFEICGFGTFSISHIAQRIYLCELSYTTWPPKQITTNHVCFVGWRTATSQVSPGIYGYRFDEDSVVLNKLICFIRLSTFFRHLLVTLSPRGIIVKKYIVNHGAIACRICFIGYKPDLHIQIQNSKFKIQHSNWTVDGARFIAWFFWRRMIPTWAT